MPMGVTCRGEPQVGKNGKRTIICCQRRRETVKRGGTLKINVRSRSINYKTRGQKSWARHLGKRVGRPVKQNPRQVKKKILKAGLRGINTGNGPAGRVTQWRKKSRGIYPLSVPELGTVSR